MDRYERNHAAISQEEQALLSTRRVFVAGCGGLGGYILEYLGRLGVGHLTAADGDVFNRSNLNRQLLSTEDTIGKNKALTARERMEAVNPEISFTPVPEFLSAGNAGTLVANHHLVVDALDNVETRLLLFHAAQRAGIPMIHGAIAGWCLRVAAVFPEDTVLPALWESAGNHGVEAASGNLCFTAACAAALEAAEAVKLLLGRGTHLRRAILEIDLLNGTLDRIDLAER